MAWWRFWRFSAEDARPTANKDLTFWEREPNVSTGLSINDDLIISDLLTSVTSAQTADYQNHPEVVGSKNIFPHTPSDRLSGEGDKAPQVRAHAPSQRGNKRLRMNSNLRWFLSSPEVTKLILWKRGKKCKYTLCRNSNVL